MKVPEKVLRIRRTMLFCRQAEELVQKAYEPLLPSKEGSSGKDFKDGQKDQASSPRIRQA